jgi:2-polyprenyl-3-methyl-5-hydroxy-6-metoxy-1,4-benzoquinol methylase
MQRPDIQDPEARRIAFGALSRTLGPWLPPDRAAGILDAGCGEGALLAFLTESGYSNLSGFDLSKENVECCGRSGFTFVREFDALRIADYPGPETYDVIFALDLLEHLPKESTAAFLQGAFKRLRPGGGALILQTPNMGSLLGWYCFFNDLTHQFGVTENSAADLLAVAGFARNAVEVRPAWYATSRLGRMREFYAALCHRLLFLAEGAGRPRIAAKNLLIRAVRT